MDQCPPVLSPAQVDLRVGRGHEHGAAVLQRKALDDLQGILEAVSDERVGFPTSDSSRAQPEPRSGGRSDHEGAQMGARKPIPF